MDIIKQVVKRPKVRRKSRKFVSSSAGLVDRVREMVEQCREEERAGRRRRNHGGKHECPQHDASKCWIYSLINGKSWSF